MSGRFQVSIALKDPNGIFKRLENLEKNGIMARMGSIGGGGGGGSSTSGVNGVWRKMQDLSSNSLVKLAGISVGVGSLVALAHKSSGILEGTFKMFERNFMLFIKPIADFFGLILRPIAQAMYQLLIKPFYEIAAPFFRDLSVPMVKFFSDPLGALAGLGGLIGSGVVAALVGKKLFDINMDKFADKIKCNDCNGKGGMGSNGCIKLCEEPPKTPPPSGIPTGLPIPVPVGGLIPGGTPTGDNWWNRVPGPFSTNIPTVPMSSLVPSASSVSPFFWPERPEGLGQPDLTFPNIVPQMNGIQQDFDEALAESTGIPQAVGLINQAFAAAAQAINDGVRALQNAANNPQAFGGGMGGTGGIRIGIPLVGAPTRIAGIADTLE